MRILAALIAFLAFIIPAHAADKGGPATLEQIMAMPVRQALAGCYGEIGAAGTFLAEGDRQASGLVGTGCDYKLDMFVVGFGVRAFAGETTAGSFAARLGFAVNPNLTLYAGPEFRFKDWKAKGMGQMYGAIGAETSLPVRGLSAYVEGSTALSAWRGATRDDVTTLTGLRWRW